MIHTFASLTSNGTALVSEKRRCDVVIVGAGPGGAAAARTLCRAGLSVVMLEDGSWHQPTDFRREFSFAQRHLYAENQARIASGDMLTFMPVVSGRGVGGGSLVNSAICFRAPRSVLERWSEEFGVEHAEPTRLTAHYEEVERTILVNPTRREVAGGNSLIARLGAERLGLKHDFMPRNAEGCAGCGVCDRGCPVGGKGSVDLNFIPQAERDGLELFANTRCTRIVHNGSHVSGVVGTVRDPSTRLPAGEIIVEADHVVVACGAIGTALLLQRQEITTNEHLGRNLRVHPASGAMAWFAQEIKIWQGATQGYYAHHPDDDMVLLETFSAPIQVFFAQIGGVGVDSTKFYEDIARIAGSGCMIGDSTSGTVRPGDRGKARIEYAMVEEDFARIIKGLALSAEVFFAAGAERVQLALHTRGPVDKLEDARRILDGDLAPRDVGIYSSHPMGTCRIGKDPDQGVVDSRGRVYGFDNLSVMDSSVFPTSVGRNPQMTVMAMALAMSEQLVGELT